MKLVFIGNLIMFLGSVVMVLAGFCKNRKSTVFLQTVQMGIMAFGTFCLGSFSGAIMNCFSAIRNILSYHNKLTNVVKAILIVLSACVALSVNNLGFIGYLPIIVFVMYALFINAKDVIWHKVLAVVGCTLFFVHDFYIQSYTSCVFNTIAIWVNAISATNILFERRRNAIKAKRVAA